MQFSWEFEDTNEDVRRWGGKDMVSYIKNMLQMMKQHPDARRVKKMVIWKVRKAHVCSEFPWPKQDRYRGFQFLPLFYQSALICVPIKVILAAVTKITWNLRGFTH